jgi:hypothetical protein
MDIGDTNDGREKSIDKEGHHTVAVILKPEREGIWLNAEGEGEITEEGVDEAAKDYRMTPIDMEDEGEKS